MTQTNWKINVRIEYDANELKIIYVRMEYDATELRI